MEAECHAELARARQRLTKASDAWLDAYDGDGLSQQIVDEYYAAYRALVALRNVSNA